MHPRSDLIDRLSSHFAELPEVSTAYLFGSHARGAAGPASDADLAVVLDPVKIPQGRPLHRRQLELIADLMAALGTTGQSARLRSPDRAAAGVRTLGGD